MTKPTETKDIRQELAKLESDLKGRYFADLKTTDALKIDTMRGNTARAYRKEGEKPGCYLNYTPTSIFRNWLHYHYFQNPDTMKQLNGGGDFEIIHTAAVQGLERFWRETEPDVTGLEYFHFSKLVDLLFKSIPRWVELSEERRLWFFNNAHVPLDKYSLLALKEYAPHNVVKSLGLKPNPSMGDVENESHYQRIQSAIKSLIEPYPPLLFDLFAWNHLRLVNQDMRYAFELVKVK